MATLNRHIKERVIKALKAFPIVYINGPRQAGKTTLVSHILTSVFPATYLTFDDAMERSAASRNPLHYLRAAGYPLILDEVQLVPQIFRPLKQLVDEARVAALSKRKKPNGHYLLTGSANLMVLPELARAMVGRMATITLLPLSAGEIQNVASDFITRCFARDFSGIKPKNDVLLSMISRASFPELLSLSESQKHSWFQNYIQKITLDDPRQLYRLEKAEYMPTLLQALATRAGNLINDADLGRDVGLNAVTTRQYRGLLNSTFITETLRPWHRNINKRLVKSGKLFFYDTSLLCHLLRTTPKELLTKRPDQFGHVLENFVFSELRKINTLSDNEVDVSFYRTRDGKEVDFVLERAGKIVAIEVKHAEVIQEKNLSGLREFQSETGKDFVCGVVLCNTPRVIAYDKNIYLVPLSVLWG